MKEKSNITRQSTTTKRSLGPKRSLGQNFLTSQAIAAQIAKAAKLTKRETALEIGPGKGMLTRELLSRAGHVVAIEKDDALFEELQEQFPDELHKKKLTLIHADALGVALKQYGLKKGGYKLVANIPYNITGLLLRHFLSHALQPSVAVLLVQKEVAQRICTKDKKESILSMSVKAYGVPSIARTVRAGSFYPKPNVDSAVLIIEEISRNNFASKKQEEQFFMLLKMGFSKKRKQLAHNLKPLFGKSVSEKLAAVGIDPKTRAEELRVSNWLELSKLI